MTYNEQTAATVVEKFGLSRRTIVVWAHRGSIPDKYFTPDGAVKDGHGPPVTGADAERLRIILSLHPLNLSGFTSIQHTRLHDFARGKGNVYEKEHTAIKKELSALKNLYAAMQAATVYGDKVKKLRLFVKSPLVKPFSLCDTVDQRNALDAIIKGHEPRIQSAVTGLAERAGLFIQSINFKGS